MILRLLLTREDPALVAIDADNALCETRFAPLYRDTTTALGVWRVLREDNVRLCRAVSATISSVGAAPSGDPTGG